MRYYDSNWGYAKQDWNEILISLADENKDWRKNIINNLLSLENELTPATRRWVSNILGKIDLTLNENLLYLEKFIQLGSNKDKATQKLAVNTFCMLHKSKKLSEGAWSQILSKVVPVTGKANAIKLIKTIAKTAQSLPDSFSRIFLHSEPDVQICAWEISEKKGWKENLCSQLISHTDLTLCSEISSLIGNSHESSNTKEINREEITASRLKRFRMENDLELLQQGKKLDLIYFTKDIPDLNPQLKLQYIRDIDELLKLEKKVYNSRKDDLNIEVFLEGFIWFYKHEKDELFKKFRRSLKYEIDTRYKHSIHSKFIPYPSSNCHILVVAAVTEKVFDIDDRQHFNHLSIYRFQNLNKLLMKGNDILLATPTHSDGRIDALVFVERFLEKRLISETEMCLALHRLSMSKRNVALKKLLNSNCNGEYRNALAYALGADGIEIGRTALIWAAAGRARNPYKEDEFICEKVGFNNLCQPHNSKLSQCPDNSIQSSLPESIQKLDSAIILALNPYKLDEYDYSLWPANSDPALRYEYNQLGYRISDSGASDTFLGFFYSNPSNCITDIAFITLVAALMYKNKKARIRALETVSFLISEGRINATKLIDALDKLLLLDCYFIISKTKHDPIRMNEVFKMAERHINTGKVTKDDMEQMKMWAEKPLEKITERHEKELKVSPFRLIQSIKEISTKGERESLVMYNFIIGSTVHFLNADSRALSLYFENLYLLSVKIKVNPPRILINTFMKGKLSGKAGNWIKKLNELKITNETNLQEYSNTLLYNAKVNCVKRTINWE